MMDMAIAIADYGQVGSNPSTPDSHHYFPLADHPEGGQTSHTSAFYKGESQ